MKRKENLRKKIFSERAALLEKIKNSENEHLKKIEVNTEYSKIWSECKNFEKQILAQNTVLPIVEKERKQKIQDIENECHRIKGNWTIAADYNLKLEKEIKSIENKIDNVLKETKEEEKIKLDNFSNELDLPDHINSSNQINYHNFSHKKVSKSYGK